MRFRNFLYLLIITNVIYKISRPTKQEIANQSRFWMCDSWHSFAMRFKALPILFCLLLPLAASAQQRISYTWVDEDGIRHYGDSIPPEFSEVPKDLVNEHGVKVGHIRGKKTPEELEAERVAAALKVRKELQLRADRALLSTYQNVDEIEMHRDRRVELFQAQSRVTELYLRNLDRRLQLLKKESSRFRPYSSDPSAPMIESSLVREIQETENTIDRHESNLQRYQHDERTIIERFEGDINRFKNLKGITMSAAQTLPE